MSRIVAFPYNREFRERTPREMRLLLQEHIEFYRWFGYADWSAKDAARKQVAILSRTTQTEAESLHLLTHHADTRYIGQRRLTA